MAKVIHYKPLRDDLGRFVPYCDYGWHLGIPRNPQRCESLGCRHYRKLYLPNPKSLNSREKPEGSGLIDKV